MVFAPVLVLFWFCLCRWLPPSMQQLSLQLTRNNHPSVLVQILTISDLLKLVWSTLTVIKTTIIMERVVQPETLQETFIRDVFKERTWTKLLNPSGTVYDEIIREFFSNATVERNEINCWVRQKEFVITRQDIQDFLEVRPPSQPITTQYEDRIGAIGEMIQILSGTPTKQSMNTLKFTPDMRALAHIMLHNLYLVTNLTTFSVARTRFCLISSLIKR